MKKVINNSEEISLRHFEDDLKAFLEYSNGMQVIYKNNEYYNPEKENKVLIILDDIIADIIKNKNLNSIVTELFTRGRKLNVQLFLSHSHISKVL